MDNKKDEFNYTYSAPNKSEREEVEDIRKKYLPKSQNETKLQMLKRLDNRVKNVPTVWSLCIGIVGTLFFGLGLTMILEWNVLVWGVIVAIVGAIPMLLAYPVYRCVNKKVTEKYREDILKLSDELLNEDK